MLAAGPFAMQVRADPYPRTSQAYPLYPRRYAASIGVTTRVVDDLAMAHMVGYVPRLRPLEELRRREALDAYHERHLHSFQRQVKLRADAVCKTLSVTCFWS